MATDNRTDESAAAALASLLDYPLADFPSRRLTAEDFLRLIEPDEVRVLLAWIADPKGASDARTAEAWRSSCGLVKATFGIDMNAKGARQIAIERLSSGQGAWRKVLERVDEAPEQHRAVCEELRKAEGLSLPGMFEPTKGTSADNQLQEQLLGGELTQAADLHIRRRSRASWRSRTYMLPVAGSDGQKLGEAPLARDARTPCASRYRNRNSAGWIRRSRARPVICRLWLCGRCCADRCARHSRPACRRRRQDCACALSTLGRYARVPLPRSVRRRRCSGTGEADHGHARHLRSLRRRAASGYGQAPAGSAGGIRERQLFVALVANPDRHGQRKADGHTRRRCDPG